jgi:ParB-like chromosome segregation protein Spo0J
MESIDNDAAAVELTLGEIVTGEHVRVAGINADHVQTLANSDGEFPPILVQRGTMRVIDGIHRLKAAELRGDTHIRVLLLDVDDQAAFMASVAANIAHGLPLSLSDRKAAAARMAALYPHWSDRALGRACGLSGKTISALQVRSTATNGQPERRIGLDGRSRPVDSGARRRIARDLLSTRPEMSLREVAREAGISHGTVRKVRDSLRGELSPAPVDGGVPAPVFAARPAESLPPVRPSQARRPANTQSLSARAAVAAQAGRADSDPEHILHSLRQDPALIYRAHGRDLLRLLQRRPVLAMGQDVIDAIPSHCLPAIAALARHYANEWAALTGMLESRAGADAA